MFKELAIIDTIAQVLGNPADLANDAYWDSESRLIYTTDMLVEHRHFERAYFSPEDLGWKAAAVNISDIAGMGGRLKYLLVSLGLPDDIDTGFITGFYQGMQALAQQYQGAIIGGDTVGAPQIIVNVTAIGTLPSGHTIGCRNQAKVRDFVVVSGHHGLGATGLKAFQHQEDGYESCKQKHLRPEPQIEAGLWLSENLERYALMDSSDGLADALVKIANASGVRIIVDKEKLVLHPEISQYCKHYPDTNPWNLVLYGGEDFELVATIPPEGKIPPAFQVIGRVEAVNAPDEAGAFMAANGTIQKLDLNRTFQHFHA